jgi:uncharacterized protein YceH (UPF0502 family)
MSDAGESLPPVTSLTKVRRRVLGVLIEKGFTTPDQYPLTLKAATTGCNQKNNRDPLTSYEEADVEQAMDGLRELGLAAVVHTESGRTERYRHYMRKRFPEMSEAQLAILGELLLRGRQQVGELRARASRMAAIDSLDALRTALEGLIAQKFVQTDGPLERRGAEVDHNWYESREGMTLSARPSEPEPAPSRAPPAPASAPVPAPTPDVQRKIDALEETCRELRNAHREVQMEVAQLREQISQLRADMETLRRDLGG